MPDPYLTYGNLSARTSGNPIPQIFSNAHRKRVLDINMVGIKDWNPSDWNTNIVNVGGTVSAALHATINSVCSGPQLVLTGGATPSANDGYGASHLSKIFPMPCAVTNLNAGAVVYVAFDICTNSSSNSGANRAVGIATGSAADAFTLGTGAVFPVGGGIAWVSVGAGVWVLTYKASTKAAVVLGTSTITGTNGNSSFIRLGFTYGINPNAADGPLGWICGFCFKLNSLAPGLSWQGSGEDQDLPISSNEYFPSPAGFLLDNTNHGEASDVRAGLFMANGQSTGSSNRSMAVRRILAIDNLRA